MITNDLGEELRYIEGSCDFYITNYGSVYKKINNKFEKRNTRINERNGYVYSSIKYKDENIKKGTQRVHILVAKCYIPNPDPYNLILVGHKDNNKQNNIYTNLYWTTNQENTKKASDDGLIKYDKGIDNKNSQPLKVIDKNTNELIAVYGSARECERMIENISVGGIMKSLKAKLDYKPRTRKYKYIPITKEEYINTSDKYKNLKLIENKQEKKVCRFKATNINTGECEIGDNQKQFSIKHNIPQASISACLKGKSNLAGDWKFEIIEELDFMNYSGYDNYINTLDDIKIQNVFTGEILEFKHGKELKDYFGFTGHDLRRYITHNNLICSKWKIITD